MKKTIRFIAVLALTLLIFALASCNLIEDKNNKNDPSVTLTADKETALPGDTVTFTATVENEDPELTLSYEITAGSSLASIDEEGKLTVSVNAVHGDTVTVRAKYGDAVSNSVSVTVNVPLESITIASNKTEIVKGSYASLSLDYAPHSASINALEWVVTEGADSCTVDSNRVFVNEDAVSETTIKLHAKVGDIVSNELTFTVKGGLAEQLLLDMSDDRITVDVNGTSVRNLIADIYTYAGTAVTDKKVVFEIIEGEEFLDITANGNVCSFAAKGHGQAKIQTTIEGTNISEITTVSVIVPPELIKLPDVFTERAGHRYSFSKVDSLPFAVSALGNNVCTDLAFTITDTDGNLAGTYENGSLTFTKTGLVTVKVSSASGSAVETTATYTFNVNDGINVYTFEQLKSTLESSSYNGQQVNIVVLEKPAGVYKEENAYTYGYDLVPAFALVEKEDQPLSAVLGNNAGITVRDKHVYINGNLHSIDVSQARTFSLAESNASGFGGVFGSSLLDIGSTPGDRTLSVKIYDLDIKGNCPIDYNGELSGKSPVGTYRRGIQIGSGLGANKDHRTTFLLDMNNVSVSAFYAGMRICHVINNGLVKNVTVDNCFSNGIETEASIITFENMTYGICGAAGIEVTPDDFDTAGVNHDQNQQVTFAGAINSTNLNNGKTIYMENFRYGTYTAMDIILSMLQPLAENPEVLSNIASIKMTENGPVYELNFIVFAFNDLASGSSNNSVITYENIDNAGMINVSDLTGVDTTHKYLILDINVPGLGNLGRVLLYNLNYGKTV